MGITWVDLSGSIVALRTAGTGRKRGVQGGQGEPPGGYRVSDAGRSRPIHRCCGRRPKAPQEGTRGGWVGGLPSMGIWLGGGLGRGCAGRGCLRRTDDGSRDLVVAAAVDGVSLA